MRRLGKKVLSVATGMTMVAGAVVGLAAPVNVDKQAKEYLEKAISAYFADGKANTGELKIVLGDNSFGKEGAAAALIAAAIATKAYTVETVTAGVKTGEETIDPTQYVEVKGGECQVVKKGDKAKVVVEHVTAMPGQGVTSMFNFGQSFGVLKGICAALKLPIIL